MTVPENLNMPLQVAAAQWWAENISRRLTERFPVLLRVEQRLLSEGGKGVSLSPAHLWDAAPQLRRGRFFDCSVVRLPGKEWQCHQTAALVFAAGLCTDICVGWGLDESDDFWYQHSWPFDSGRNTIIEPGNKLSRYFGVQLSPAEREMFFKAAVTWPMVGLLL